MPEQRGPALLGIFWRGLCMGAADVVPGVSGGTMAFILGIYTQLINAVKSFDLGFLRACLRFDLHTIFARPHWRFVLPLLFGIASAVAFFTHVVPLPRLIKTHPAPIYGLFFGLIVASIVVLARALAPVRMPDFVMLVVGLVLGALIVTAVPTETPETAWFIVLSGALAICAMVLPGISGSFVLLLLGKYAYVLDGIGHFKLGVVIPFAVGAAFGLFAFTRFLSWLLRHYERATLLIISGFLSASLYVIWPFQARQFVIVREESRLINSTPIWPQDISEVGLPLALGIIGFLLVVVLDRWARKRRASTSTIL